MGTSVGDAALLASAGRCRCVALWVANVGEPSTVVKLGVVGLELTLVVDDHVVDTCDGSGTWEWKERPSPGDRVAREPEVERCNRGYCLLSTLAVLEGHSAVEGNAAQRDASHEVDRVGGISEV